MAELIDDPWLTVACAGGADGCTATVSDPDFAAGGRETLYYARAFEAPRDSVNAGGVRCERDARGECTSVKLCAREDPSEDCLAPTEPRAWSSPIWVSPAPAKTAVASAAAGGTGR